MFDQDTINQLWANSGYNPNAKPRTGTQPKKKEKNFWTDQISTGTGIGGALGGAATGAALGSIVPGLGTAIGGLIGGIAGGALGSGGGELAENFVTGEEDKFKNVGQEALLGGVFSAPPIRLASGLGRGVFEGGKAIIGKQGAGAAGQAAKLSLEEALTRPGIIARGGQKLSGAANNLAVKQFSLTPSQLTNYAKKFGEDAGQTIRKYGFNSVEDVTTKGIEPLQEKFGQALRGIPGVTKQSLKQNIDSAIKELNKSAASDNRALGSQLKSEADALLKGFGDVVDARELNLIRREFDSLVNYTQSVANPARYGVNKRMADAIRTTLQKSDPSGQLKDIGMEISKLKQLADAVAKQENVGRGSSPLGMLNLLGGIAGGVPGGIPGALAGAGVASAINSTTGRRALMGGASKLSQGANKSAQRQTGGILPAGMTPRGVAGRLGTVGVATGAMDQAGTLEDAITSQLSFENSGTNNAMDTTNAPMSAAPINSSMTQSYQNNAQMSSPYSRENLMYDLQRDPANADKYFAYYQQLQEVFAPQGADLSAAAQKTLTASANAENALQQMEQTLSAAGGGSGKFFGGITNIAGSLGVNDSAAAYNDMVQAYVPTILQALGKTDAPSETELKGILRSMPQIDDSPGVVQQKLRDLRAQIAVVKQNATRYGGGTGGGLEDALLQAQGGF